MNLELKPFSFKQLLVKIIAYVLLFYLLIILASLAITGYIFLNLEGYKQRIEKTIYKHTGYHLQVGSIETKLSRSYVPEVFIKDIDLVNPINRKQSMHINTLDFVFSYSSIWDLEPIFSQILVDGTTINVEYDPSGNIFVNGININNPDRQTLENTKNSPVDIEKWTLKQHNITLDHVNLTYHDYKNDLPKIEINNLKIGLSKAFWAKHHLYIDIFGKNYQNMIEAELNWQGGKFEDWQDWNTANLKIKSVNGNSNDKVLYTIQQYLPVMPSATEFNAATALEADMRKGQLQKLYANFDINNFKLALADADLVSFPKLGGRIKIQLLNNQYYMIQAKDLVVVTGDGALFNNAQITGSYIINKSGQVELSNTNLVAINNILSIFRATQGINIDGDIQKLQFNWKGALLKPESYQLLAAFDDITLKSSRPELPSLSHVSGDITIRNDSGRLNLKLKNSILNYDKIFLIPYVFESVNSQIGWQIAPKNKQLTVTLHKTNLITKDFKGWAEGSYHTEPDKPDSIGYLNLRAHVERVLTSKVGDYLPKAIPMSVHKWLNMALIGGYGANAYLTLRGPLDEFPYEDNKSGLFYITADIDRAKLRYVKDWPTLDNIQGQFILKNANITIKEKSALVENNHLDAATVVIPDYAAHEVYLTAIGKAHGTTANFMTFLRKTPINEIIGKIPERVIAKGDGKVDLNLKVPFKDPLKTQVKGSYTFYNNTLKFELPIPELTKVNGDLDFAHNGLDISDIKAYVFDSKVNLNAKTDYSGRIVFKAKSSDLDYQQLAKFYLPPVSNLVSGSAATEVEFEITKHGIQNLTARSNLVGLECSAAAPLRKSADQVGSMYLNLKPNVSNRGYLLNFDYASQLKGQVQLGKRITTNSLKLALGRGTPYLHNPDKGVVTSVNAVVESINISEWLDTVKKVTDTIKKVRKEQGYMESSNKIKPLIIEEKADPEKLVFPIQIVLKSSKIKFGKARFKSGAANIFVDAQKTYFNIYTPVVSGSGYYNYAKNKLNLNIDRYMLFKLPSQVKATPESNIALNFVNGSPKVESQTIPNIDLVVNNLFYQNHELGKVTANIHQEKNDLYLDNGVLAAKDAVINFNGVNYCFGCGRDASYVDLQFNAQVKNAGDLIYDLDLGRILDKGNGTVAGALQWNGGLQDFNIFQTVGSVNASLDSGKFLQVNPGVLGGLLSIINLQGLFEVGSFDFEELFKKGFYFNHLDINADILTTQVQLKRVYMSGPMAKVNSSGKVNFATDTVDAYISVAPKLGVTVALTAGVATLNPFIGLGVYAGELLFGDPQNKLFTFSYHVTGSLAKPKIKRTSITKQFVKNVNSAIGNSNNGAN